ncbi:MAG: ABC transporter permease [Firmicutes bacterium]|nr:ABC transporter permease [Bacillota bacterium]
MAEKFRELAPNVYNYSDRFAESMKATFQMFFIAGLLTLLIGGFFGILLIVTKPGGIKPNRAVHTVLEIITNVFRSIPFIILLIFLIPFTRMLVGTSIGVKGAVVPLVFGAVPFFTRQVESALSDVDPGKVEAARSMGSGTLGIIFRVYLKEALPDLIRVITITAISTIGLTTSAGAVGAGGIGSFAINYGQNMHYQDIVNVCVVVLLIIVSLIQIIGNTLARRTYNRELFKK